MRNDLAKTLAVHKFHGDKGKAFIFAHVIDGCDIRVLKHAQGPPLIVKSLEQIRVIGHAGCNCLQRHQHIDFRMAGLINHTHGSTTELSEHFVLSYRLHITRSRMLWDRGCGKMDGSSFECRKGRPDRPYRHQPGHDGQVPPMEAKLPLERETPTRTDCEHTCSYTSRGPTGVSWELPTRPYLPNFSIAYIPLEILR